MAQFIPLVLGLLLSQLPGGAGTFPPADEFARQVRATLADGYHAQDEFTYLEERREIDISLLGKVTVGPLRTFEVYPSRVAGHTYKRLIAVDGQPLDAEELARRDAEHARNLQEAAARAARETPRQRAARLRTQAEEQRELEAILNDAVTVFQPVFAGRERIDGRSVLIVDLHPRPDAVVTTRQGGWMQHFNGRIWVDEATYRIVRLDMRAFRDITIGWGVVGRIDEGSRVRFASRWFDGAWLPAELTYEASGRTLLVRPFRIATTTTYSDYRRTAEAAGPPGPDGEATGGV